MREIKASTKVTGARRWASVEAAKGKVKNGEYYFILRYGSFFRPGAHRYCSNVAEAGVFTAEKARSCLDVEGISVVPVRSMRAELIAKINEATDALAVLRTMLNEPAKFAQIA